jgi:hypothetical protein
MQYHFKFIKFLFSSFCATCQFRPDIVLELSDLREELPVLLEESLLVHAYGEFDPIDITNSHMKRLVSFKSKHCFHMICFFVFRRKEEIKMLYGGLKVGQRDQLRDFYKTDFEIHNYSKHTFY